MSVLKWLIAGVVGAGIGGAIWVLVGYFGNLEVGYIAWGIGLLAGLGVRRTMAAEEVNPAAGIAAVAAALLVVSASKYYVAHLHVERFIGPALEEEAELDPIVYFADDVVAERVQTGAAVAWPEGMTQENAVAEADYPPDVWAEALVRWQAKPESEQTTFRDAKRTERAEQIAAFRAAAREEAIRGSFGPYDLLWFGLAMMTAYKVGRGTVPEISAAPPTEPDAPPDEPQPPAAQV